MSDDPVCRHLQANRRQVLRIVSGVTVLGAASTVASTTAAADPGDQEWAFETATYNNSSPTVVDGTVFIGGRDGNLYAVAADAGTEQWIFQTGNYIESSPTVVDGTVFVGSYDGNLYAVEADTGTEEWAFETNGSVFSSPTVVDGTVFVGSGDNLYAVDANMGTEEWAFEADAGILSSPTVANGTVFVGSNDNNLYAVDAETGTEEWTFQTANLIQSSPTIADGTVFVGSYDNNLYAVDADTGTEEWARETGGSVSSSPTVAAGTVFVGSHDDNLWAVDAETGRLEWSVFETDGFIESSPTVVGGTVYVGSNDGNLYAVDTETGTQQWTFRTGNRIESSPLVVDGTVFVGSDNLYAVDAGGVDSSEGSRATLGTLGHHDNWQYVNQSVNIPWYTLYYSLVRNNAEVLAGMGIIGVCGYGVLRYLSDRSQDLIESSDTGTADTEPQSTGDSPTEASSTDSGQLEERATEAIDRAETFTANSDYERAEVQYKEAITQLKQATAAADNDDTQSLETKIEDAQVTLKSVTVRREQRESVATTLQAAERSFQEAIARYAAGNQTVSRIRFRQARNAFQDAQQTVKESSDDVLASPLTVCLEERTTLPSTALTDLALLEDSTLESLSADDIVTISELEATTNEMSPEVISNLKQNNEISEKETTLLTLLSWWHDDNCYEFATEAAISRRYDQADYGFNEGI